MTIVPLPRLVFFRLGLLLGLVFGCGFGGPAEALAQSSMWLSTRKVADTAYFFHTDRITRYDLASRAWLEPIFPPAGRAAITAAWTDGTVLLIAYGSALYRSDAQGGNEVHLFNASGAIRADGLFASASHIYVGHAGGTASLSRSTGAVVAAATNWFYSSVGWSYSPIQGRIFARSSGVSPSDILYMVLNSNGTFGGQFDSPYHGDYPSGTRTWLFPGESKVADSTGVVYSTTDLTYLQAFGAPISDLQFNGDVPIVLSGNMLTAYTNTLLPAGSRILAETPEAFYVQGTDALTFKFDSGASNAARVAIVPLGTLSAPAPGQAVNPVGVAFTPDHAFLDRDGLLYLLSRSQQSIFRWDPTAQHWLDTIPLVGIPDHVAYTPKQHVIYLAYGTGLVRKLELDAETLTEVPFVNLPTSLRGLAVADDYLFTVDRTGAWGALHSTYDADGVRVDYRDWNYFSQSYQWSTVRQKIYFFRDDTSPNDLLSQEINANGTAYPALAPGKFGLRIDSPLHTSDGFTHPIRISPDHATIVLGSGRTHDAATLARRTESIANSFTDAAWFTSGELRTLRNISGVTQLQQWSGNAYTPGSVLQLPGGAHRLLPLAADRMLAVLLDPKGRPAFYVVTPDNSIVPPPVLAAPVGLEATLTGATSASLGWNDVTGETGYLVQSASALAGPWTDLGSTGISATSFSLTGLSSGQIKYYRVLATNGTSVSTASEAVRLSFEPPSMPTGLVAAAASATAITVSWNASSNTANYILERNLPPALTWTQIASPLADATSFIASSLSVDTEYRFRLRAVNAVGASSNTEPVTARTQTLPTSVPGSLIASSVSATSVILSWGNVSYELGYEIERRLGLSAWEPLASTAANVTTFTDATVLPQLSYQYRVRAYNALGASAFSSPLTVNTPAIAPPLTPASFTASYHPGPQVHLAWSGVANVTSYRLERQVGEAAWTVIATIAPPSASYVDTSVLTERVYSYRLVAIGPGGESPPTAPRTLNLYPLNLVLDDDFDRGISPLVWQQSIGGAALDGGAGFGGSPVFWFGGGGSRQAVTYPIAQTAYAVLEFSFRMGDAAAGVSAYWDAAEVGETVVLEWQQGGGAWQYLLDLPNHPAWRDYQIILPATEGTDLRLRWRQLAHSGQGYDAWALENVRVQAYAPSPAVPPSFLFASPATDTSVGLFWSTVPGAVAYLVERSEDLAVWTRAALLPAAQAQLTDTGLFPATWYAYRVSAITAGGVSAPSLSTWVSTYSQIAAWRLENFGSTALNQASAPLAVSDDGVANLLKYAFNLDHGAVAHTLVPGQGSSGMPFIHVDPATSCLCVEYIRRRPESAPGIRYHVEFSTNLNDWTSLGQAVEEIEQIDAIWQRVRVHDPVMPASGAPRFGRVRVEGIAP